jgi:hypothetical protein
MNTTPNALPESNPETIALILLALIMIVLMLSAWNWVCRMRDHCIQRARIKQLFTSLSAMSRADFIERYRSSLSNGTNADMKLMSEITAYVLRTKKRNNDILAMLIDWHTTELADVQPVADA